MKDKKINKIKIITIIIGLIALAGILLFLFSGKNFEIFKEFFRKGITRDEIRQNARELGVRGVVSVGLLSMLQVVFMFLPAEPVQVIAGVSYGLWFGILLCLIGVFAGNTLIYVLYRIFGKRLNKYFSENIDIDFTAAKTFRILASIIFVLYFLPAIPYGMICFFAASTGMNYPKYITITLLGSLPSVAIGVGLGHLAIESSLIWAAAVFAVLLVVVIVIIIKKDRIIKALNSYLNKRNKPYTSDTEVREPNKFMYRTFTFFVRIYLFFKVKTKFRNNAGKLPKPSIVLVTHGSFPDFMYVLKYLIGYYPHIVTARMYFYHKFMGNIMRKGGIFPKSMFTADIESARNCLRVLKNRGILIMMPEARLSTVGRFEGIQNVTAKFLYKAGAPIYVMKIHGNYLAKPKWGKGMRRGARVECTLDKLADAEELKNTDYATFVSKLDEAMYYDEFEWLETKPKQRYKSAHLAEGLEGILYKCPVCGAECTGETRGHILKCGACGNETRLNDRYKFEAGAPFADIRGWWDYQYQTLLKEISENEEWFLESKTELKHSSSDGKTILRHSGEGVCRLDRSGLRYIGTEDGKETEKFFPRKEIYRLLFGVNEDFEIYEGKEIYYFVPEDKRICAKWYLASAVLEEYFFEDRN